MQSFWNKRRVLVTGHTGFKGSWLSLWLQQMGAKVVGVSIDPPTGPNLFSKANVVDDMTSLHCDINQGEKVKKIFKQYQPEVIFHLAAQSLVRYSYANPVETYQTNVMGSLNILEAVRSVDSVRSVIMVTSDKCYENREWTWGYRENDSMGGHDPYSSSKGCAELLVTSYQRSYFSLEDVETHKIGIASVRAGNVIGGGDWGEDRLVPDIIKSLISGDKLLIRNPHALRPWQHVLEPLSGYLLLAEKMFAEPSLFSGAWNFGPHDQDIKPVSWLVDKLLQQWGGESDWDYDQQQKPHEAVNLKLDCSKAHQDLGWWPRWSLSTTLEKITEWHRADVDARDLKQLCHEQISTFENTSAQDC